MLLSVSNPFFEMGLRPRTVTTPGASPRSEQDMEENKHLHKIYTLVIPDQCQPKRRTA